MPTYKEALVWAVKQLTDACVDGPRLDAEVLLIHVAGINRAGLYSRWDELLASSSWEAYQSKIAERMQGRPVAYIIGTREFMSLDFAVNEQVLIPRPETEILVEWVLNELRGRTGPRQARLVDVGTGSGAIAISLAKYLPRAVVWAVDLSLGALEVAKDNATSNGVGQRVTFVQSNLLGGLGDAMTGQLDWVVANLPYIPSGQISGLQKEVHNFEPHSALEGGPDGLDLYRQLLPQAEQVLKVGGWIGMEIAFDQAAALTAILNSDKWEQIQVLKDYAGLDRHVVARRR